MSKTKHAEPSSSPLPTGAVIHFGASSVTLLVGELKADRSVNVLDYLEKPLPLARDIFRSGIVTRPVMEQAAAILRDFQQTLVEYAVPPAEVRSFTTNILSEATNHEIFLNRMQITSGSQVEMIDDGDMTRLIYQTTVRLLKSNPEIANASTLVSHIGPGNTRALYFQKNRILGYSSYRLGIYRTREAVAGAEIGAAQQLLHIEEQIRGVVDYLATDYSDAKVDFHVAIGAEIQSAGPHIVEPRQGACFIPLKKLEKFTEAAAAMTADEMVRRLHLRYSGGEGMVAALQTNLALSRRFNDEVLVVPQGDFHRDLLMDLLANNPQTSTFQDEVLQAARVVGRKFKTDHPHAAHVGLFAQKIFHELQPLHGLDAKHLLLMRVAAILHEVGMFVSAREHHKHSLYLILNTEVFGLSLKDRTLVALLARYIRRYNPDPSHPHFSDLSREERMTVIKLAAILRIADALDRSHSQRIKDIRLKREGDVFHIEATGVNDTTVEQLAVNSKSDIFQEIYGCEVVVTPA
jgi:exopolyphosphatase/guanosine-5'-triphosphate,3'-diphosphate pyrophosphatase